MHWVHKGLLSETPVIICQEKAWNGLTHSPLKYSSEGAIAKQQCIDMSD